MAAVLKSWVQVHTLLARDVDRLQQYVVYQQEGLLLSPKTVINHIDDVLGMRSIPEYGINITYKHDLPKDSSHRRLVNQKNLAARKEQVKQDKLKLYESLRTKKEELKDKPATATPAAATPPPRKKVPTRPARAAARPPPRRIDGENFDATMYT